MNKIIVILSLICATPLFSQDSLTTADVQGTWHLTAEREENSPLLNADIPYTEGFTWSYPDIHWVIKGNKIYEIAYPCCLQNTYTFKTFADGIYVEQNRGEVSYDMMYKVAFSKDSMVLDDIMYIASRTLYLYKDTLPKKKIDQLIAGSIDPTCLYGDWEIPVGEVSVPFDAILVWYPYKLPETIHIDAKNIHHYWANNQLYLEVDGVKKPFTVASVSLNDDDLTLTAGKWVKTYQKELEYDSYTGSSVWLRKIPKEE